MTNKKWKITKCGGGRLWVVGQGIKEDGWGNRAGWSFLPLCLHHPLLIFSIQDFTTLLKGYYIYVIKRTEKVRGWRFVVVKTKQDLTIHSKTHQTSGGRYPGFLIEWISYWIESSQIKIFESIFELNFPGKQIIE